MRVSPEPGESGWIRIGAIGNGGGNHYQEPFSTSCIPFRPDIPSGRRLSYIITRPSPRKKSITLY
jgi:hypothetical protein